LDTAISRLSSLSDTTGTLESYDYLGLGTVVRRAHPQPGVDLTYIKQSGESNGDAGDQYTGLDRFDRVVDQRWLKTSDGSHTDRFKYGYDRNGNRLYRENLVNAVFSELYSYDQLNQLTSFSRGTLNGTKDAIVGTPSRSQSWDFDALGNFDSQTTDGVAQTRSHNKQNQITAISGLTTPAYDGNGNMTTDEQGRTLKYDAWGRFVEVKQGTTVLASYSHDGLKRRVAEGSRALYYSAQWQVVEERESGVVVVQSVFSPVYVDAIVLRDRDADANGTLEERLWAQQDANWNVTALRSGISVVERFMYDSYGASSVLTAAWAAQGATLYAWMRLHQGGRRNTETGMYNFRNRELSSLLGRWTSQDPLGFGAGDVNLFRCEDGNPICNLDPTGLSTGGTTYIFCLVGKIACLQAIRQAGILPGPQLDLLKKACEDAFQQCLKSGNYVQPPAPPPVQPPNPKPPTPPGPGPRPLPPPICPPGPIVGAAVLGGAIVAVTVACSPTPPKNCRNPVLIDKSTELTGIVYRWRCADGTIKTTFERGK
jgi:RHS repeat-associated protein